MEVGRKIADLEVVHKVVGVGMTCLGLRFGWKILSGMRGRKGVEVVMLMDLFLAMVRNYEGAFLRLELGSEEIGVVREVEVGDIEGHLGADLEEGEEVVRQEVEVVLGFAEVAMYFEQVVVVVEETVVAIVESVVQEEETESVSDLEEVLDTTQIDSPMEVHS